MTRRLLLPSTIPTPTAQGSGNVGTCADFITRMTIVDSWGTIRNVDASDPDFKIFTACLGMCGIVLDVTVKVRTQPSSPLAARRIRLTTPTQLPLRTQFDPRTSGVKMTQVKAPMRDFFPRSCELNATWNPIKARSFGWMDWPAV